jgi:Zn2+/Cd2+-exporting ATPase
MNGSARANRIANAIKGLLARSRDRAQPGTDEPTKQFWHQLRTSHEGRETVLTGGLLAAAFIDSALGPHFSYWVYSAAALAGLAPVACRALMRAITGTRFTVEMLVTAATLGAILIGAAAVAAIVVFLFAVAEFLKAIAPPR